jgi:hypothetical protein
MRKMVRAGAGIFDKQEPEPEMHKYGPAPQHWVSDIPACTTGTFSRLNTISMDEACSPKPIVDTLRIFRQDLNCKQIP